MFFLDATEKVGTLIRTFVLEDLAKAPEKKSGPPLGPIFGRR